jgi:hypothetical protein
MDQLEAYTRLEMASTLEITQKSTGIMMRHQSVSQHGINSINHDWHLLTPCQNPCHQFAQLPEVQLPHH